MFSLRIQNFQSIVDVTIPFEGFCCIVGKSNLGKSALVRAFRAWAYNDCVPNAVRNGTDCFIITGTFSTIAETPSGVKSIKFIKGAKINTYSVEYHNGRIMDYPKIGKDTPIELKNLGFQILTTEKEENFNLHVQAQHDSLFLVCSTETTLTGVLNKLFGLAPYEKALRSLNSDVIVTNRQYDEKGRCLQSLATAHEALQKDAEIKGVNLRKLKELEKEIHSCEKRIEHLELGVAQHQKLAEIDSGLLPLEADLYDLSQNKEKVTPLPPALDTVSRLVEYVNHMKLQEFNTSATKTVFDVLQREHSSVTPVSQTLEKLSRVAYAIEASVEMRDNLEKAQEGWKEFPRPKHLLEELSKSLKTLHEITNCTYALTLTSAKRQLIQTTLSEITEMQKHLDAHKEELKKEVPRCPTCLQPIVAHPQAFCISKH